MQHLVISDQRVTSMATAECGEALVSIRGIESKLVVDDSAANIAGLGYVPKFVARKAVAEKLKAAARALPDGLQLMVKETLRPKSFQEFIFNRRLGKLSTERPELHHDELVALTSRFVAPPWVAGHPTGAAVDVSICTDSGQESDMGCLYDEDEKASQGRCFSFADNISEPAIKNRNALFGSLSAQGFVNYPFELWHWSYGDKYWAAVTQSPAAMYGAIG